MKILVTGSSGTIGTRLCEQLLQKGHDVIGLDWEPCQWSDEIEALRIDADLRERSAIDKIPSGVEMVVHLAANARVYELVEHPERACDNFVTTFHALEYARLNNVKKFIFASSRETYGNIPAEMYTEDMAKISNCESPYTASKIGGEALVHSYESCYDIDYINFRFSNVYGMYDNSIRVVPLFVRQARANEEMRVFGKDKCLDFTYIDDCVNGIILGIEKFDTVKNDTYNLAYSKGTTLEYLAETIKKLTNSESNIVMQDSRPGEVIRYIADISNAQNKLGYDPQTSFDEGIRKAVDWYQKNT